MRDCAVLFKRLRRDPRVPRRAKFALVLLIPYLARAIDVIPDFIPVLRCAGRTAATPREIAASLALGR